MKSAQLLLVALLVCLFSACQIVSGLMKNSGIILSIEVKTDSSNLEETTDKAVKVLQSRLNALGVSSKVTKTLPNRLEVKIYGEADFERLKSILLSEGKLELMKVVGAMNPSPLTTYPTKEAALQSLGGTIPSNRRILAFQEYELSKSPPTWIVVENPAIVDGSELRDAQAISRTGSDSDYQIGFTLNQSGAQKFGDWTGKNINSYLAVVFNDQVKSAPYIKSQIFDQGQIDGRFTKRSAEDLVLILKSGYLSATLVLLEEKTFGK